LIYFNLGGFNGVTTIFNVECFDDLTEEWLRKSNIFFFCNKNFILFRYDAADMNIFRSALSVCVLSGLNNIRNLITFARKQLSHEQKTISIIPVGTLSSAVGALTSTINNIRT